MDGTQGKVRYCSRCGATMKETSQFCPKCGAPAGKSASRGVEASPLPGISFSFPAFSNFSLRGEEYAWYWGLRLLAAGIALVLLGLVMGIASIELGLFFGILGHFIALPASTGFFAADYLRRKYEASAVMIAIILLISLVILAFRAGWGSYVLFLVTSVIAGFLIVMFLKNHPMGS